MRTGRGCFGNTGSGVVEQEPGVRDIAQALPGIFLQAQPQQVAHSHGQHVQIRLFLDHRRQSLARVFALEQALSGQQLVEDHSERPNVGALVHRFAARLLGTHVPGGSQNHSGLGACDHA